MFTAPFMIMAMQFLFPLCSSFAGSSFNYRFPSTLFLSTSSSSNSIEEVTAAPVHIIEDLKENLQSMEPFLEFYKLLSNETVVGSIGGSRDNLEKLYDSKFGVTPLSASADISFREVCKYHCSDYYDYYLLLNSIIVTTICL